MNRNKRNPTNGGINEAYPRPPKPPTYHRTSDYHKGLTEYDFKGKKRELTLPKNEQIERIKIIDYASFENFDKEN